MPSASALADAGCPSSWGFDGIGGGGPPPPPDGVPYQQQVLPGWFGGGTRCTAAVWWIDNRATVIDEASGTTVFAGASKNCGAPTRECWTPTWDGLTQTGVFTPMVGHTYRGDYFVTLEAAGSQTWLSWPADCSLDSSDPQRLHCDYHTSYRFSPTGTDSVGRAQAATVRPPRLSP